jgi:acyl carrier protein
MPQDDIKATFAQILEEVAGVNRAKVTGDQRLREDLGIDSLSLIDVAVAAEDAFGIRIPDDDLERFWTVGDAVGYIGHARGYACFTDEGRGRFVPCGAGGS